MDVAGNQKWSETNKIMERYVNLPTFASLSHTAIDIVFSDDKTYARATADTVGSFYDVNGTLHNISSDQGEKWTLAKIQGEWKITCFLYNLP